MPNVSAFGGRKPKPAANSSPKSIPSNGFSPIPITDPIPNPVLSTNPKSKSKSNPFSNPNPNSYNITGNGRKSKLSESDVESVISELESGSTLTAVLSSKSIPVSTFYRYTDRHPEAFAKIVNARKIQSQVWADSIVDNVESVPLDNNAICKARLVKDTKTWMMSRWNPAQFADKGQGVNVAVGVNVVLSEQDRLQLIERRKALQLEDAA